MTALRFQTGGRYQTPLASFQGQPKSVLSLVWKTTRPRACSHFVCRLTRCVCTRAQLIGWANLSVRGWREVSWTMARVTVANIVLPTPTLCLISRSEELRTQKLKSHLMRTQSLNVLPLKPGVGHYIAIYATLTAKDFFLAYFYPSGPFTCFFFQNLSRFFPVLAVADTGSCVGLQNKIGQPAGCRFPCSVPTEYK